MDSDTKTYFRAMGSLTLLSCYLFSVIFGELKAPNIVSGGFNVVLVLVIVISMVAFLIWTLVTDGPAGGFVGFLGMAAVVVFFLFWTVGPTEMTYAGLAIFFLAWVAGLASTGQSAAN